MNPRAELLRPDGSREPLVPRSGRHFDLREMQEAVGGFVEVLYLPDGRAMVMDEEAKSKGSAVNPMATLLASELLAPSDAIKGTVVLCSQEMLK